MNIICNNCVGARLYNISNIIFNNPFTWSLIEPLEFIKLIKDFSKINLYNIKVSLEDRQNKRSILCELENEVQIHYIHYIYKDCNFEKNYPDVYSKKIIEYFTNLYYRRLDRMIESNEKPLFLFSFNYLNKDRKDYLDIINELKALNNDNVLIIAHKTVVKETNDSNIILLDDDTMNLDGINFCKSIKPYLINE